MEAYYYGFSKTGVAEIDQILLAVAKAGKSYHHTENWEDQTPAPEGLRGECPAEWIQNAADDAAKAIIANRKEAQ